MGIEDGSGDDHRTATILAPARALYDESTLRSVFSFQRNSLESTVKHTVRLLDYPDTPEHLVLAYQALLETANRIHTAERIMPTDTLTFTQEQPFLNSDGLFDLHIRFNNANIFEIGFFFDENGSLLIKKVQKDRLDIAYRKVIRQNYGKYQEKCRADETIWHIQGMMTNSATIKAIHAHIFGLFAATAYLGPASNGFLMFPTIDHHPDILDRVQHRSHLADIDEHWGGNFQEARDKLSAEINRLKPLCDYKRMLHTVGVSSIVSPREGFLAVSIKKMFHQARHYFHNPAFPERQNLWNDLEEVLSQPILQGLSS